MSNNYVYTYATILANAKSIKKEAEQKYKKPSGAWCYYICKAILKPKTSIKKITISGADHSTGNDYSRQITKKEYLDMAGRLINFVEKNHKLPNYITVAGKNMRVSDYTYMFARVLVYYDSHKQLPSKANVNSKAFVKPTESSNKVYNAFVKTFGKITCIDDALEKIAGRGYGYYYDDKKSNLETINAIASSSHTDDPNCTDATQMMKNVADGTGKYKSVDCVHVKCRGGDGHVYLRITQKDGSVFYRDPAAVLDEGSVTAIWCSNGTVLAINPSWWVANLNR
jgi:hypothetical protein